MDWNTPSLDVLLKNIWGRLRVGAEERQDPWHTAALATVNSGLPACRTIVLRAADAAHRALVFFSDARADKISQLRQRPRVEWLFYSTPERIQLRVQAVAEVHHQDLVAEAAWRARPDLNYLHYLSPLAPGTSLPASLPLQDALSKEDEVAFGNFAVVVTRVESFDWLLVGDANHRRAEFHWNGAQFDSHWKVP